MKAKLLIILTFGLILSVASKGQAIEVIKFNDLKKLTKKENDTTYIFNFWATWCSPCVKELPYFDALANQYENEKVCIILVSLDFIRQLNSRLVPFVKEYHVRSKVLLLDEPDYNSWIAQIDKTWSGAIPATLVINNKNGVRKFYEKEFTKEELFKEIGSLHE